ncbi:hypothetical protein JOE69_001120 [Arthrobacter russicus]|uniref:Uncharacterized protein n=1 Tax=Arthrobacter russicus TaxID=172040 RepID=A0ABU1J8X9_9MICC|nr:hypothetical protein [Arthrobacter russicus]
MKSETPIKQCPVCAVYAAVNSVPHCTTRTCTWNRCSCGTTYDRYTGRTFKTQGTR